MLWFWGLSHPFTFTDIRQEKRAPLQGAEWLKTGGRGVNRSTYRCASLRAATLRDPPARRCRGSADVRAHSQPFKHPVTQTSKRSPALTPSLCSTFPETVCCCFFPRFWTPSWSKHWEKKPTKWIKRKGCGSEMCGRSLQNHYKIYKSTKKEKP